MYLMPNRIQFSKVLITIPAYYLWKAFSHNLLGTLYPLFIFVDRITLQYYRPALRTKSYSYNLLGALYPLYILHYLANRTTLQYYRPAMHNNNNNNNNLYLHLSTMSVTF